jgi:methionyl-tRNA formyltransferase
MGCLGGERYNGASMFDTIVLLTGAVEHPVLAPVLREHNPRLTVLPVSTSDELAAVEITVLRRARLIAFTTNVIVPPNVLDQLGYGAYNFHPGPPEYPGWAPAHFALYDQATEFGATLHVMVKRVDAGPIVDVERFAVPAEIRVAGLEAQAYARLAQMFWRSAKSLAICAEPLAETPIRWNEKRNSRRSYEAICDIPVNIPKQELERRIKVFGASHHGIAPTINLHGIRFRAVLPDSPQA